MAIAGLIAVPLAYLGGRKVVALAADPTGEKSCLPPSGAVTPVSEVADLPGLIRGGTIDDFSCLNATPIYGRVRVTSVGEVQAAIRYARAHRLTVSAAGARHTMGGQAFAENTLVIDMTGLDNIAVDAPARTITVGAGATWHAIQERLHPLLAVQAMQSTDIFTVGGSISVNAHGMDHQVGALLRTIRALEVVMADASVRRITPANDPGLFRLVVGGYGLFGIITSAEIAVTDNVIYRSGRAIIPTTDFPRFFAEEIAGKPDVGLFYGHLSTAPGAGFLREMLVFTYTKAAAARDDLPPLGPVGWVKARRLILNLAKENGLFAQAKWFAEKQIDPLFESCTVTLAEAAAEAEACHVSRNEPMHDSVPYLMNALTDQSDILHEYFVPRPALLAYVDAVRPLLATSGLPILNASVRVVHREDNFLTYAPEEAFSLVLYINQPATEEGNARMAALTSALIDATVAHGGRFFLPYQLHYSAAQLRASYPEIGAFFAAKRRHDPDGVFSNTFYRKYGADFA